MNTKELIMTEKDYIKTCIDLFDSKQASERIFNYMQTQIEIAKSKAVCDYIDEKLNLKSE